MKPSRFGWLVFDSSRVDGEKHELRVTLRVRRWHPGFWFFVARAVWRACR